jgi:hypothetical protein
VKNARSETIFPTFVFLQSLGTAGLQSYQHVFDDARIEQKKSRIRRVRTMQAG